MGKSTVEESVGLDVRALQRAGNLRAGARFSWRWTRGGEPAGDITGTAHETSVTLNYSYGGEAVNQRIALDWTRCNYGGVRVWWRCPNCGRRVAKIHGAGKVFACRRCYRLCYVAQLETQPGRWRRAAMKIRDRLGQKGGGHFDPIPDKPNGMHWATYERLYDRCELLEALDLLAMFQRASRLCESKESETDWAISTDWA
jgi:hypothetical protein